MRDLTKDYHPKNNFWTLYPDFTACEPFSKMYRSDKTSGKSGSSAKMWAVVLAHHPKSDFYYMTDKLSKISEGFSKTHKIDIDWDELKHIVDAFVDSTLDQAHKSLIEWERRMKERDEFLANQKWTLDHYIVDKNGDNVLSKTGGFVTEKGTADQLDRLHGTTAKHYKEYELIVKEVQELEAKEQSKKKNVEELDV